ncbi:unnamed protein product [Phaeothamnion confervicola]
MLRPAPAAEAYRRSVFRFVAGHVKRALGAACFPVGPFALRTYLPDEEVGISAFLCHGQEQTWFIRVNETLCKVSSQRREWQQCGDGAGGGGAVSGLAGAAGTAPAAGGAGGGSGVGAAAAAAAGVYEHRLSNVNFVNLGRTQCIKCVVDNQVAVDLSVNRLGELSMVAFLEEVDRALARRGKPRHLFKRALLLIKSWWLYESRSYTGSNMLGCIDEAALAAMLLAVVNEHHARLHTPLQVLAMFFQVLSRFNWREACVCVDGARLLSTLAHGGNGGGGNSDGSGGSGATVASGAPLQDPLLPPDVLAMYRSRYRAGDEGPRHESPAGGSDGGGGSGGGGVGGSGTGGNGGGVAGGGIGVGGAAVCGGGRAAFSMRPLNVMHPLDPSENLIHETVTRRRAARVVHLLQMGAQNLQPVLLYLRREATGAQRRQAQPPPIVNMHSTSVTMLDTFYSLSWARFGQGWRPDVHLDCDDDDDADFPPEPSAASARAAGVAAASGGASGGTGGIGAGGCGGGTGGGGAAAGGGDGSGTNSDGASSDEEGYGVGGYGGAGGYGRGGGTCGNGGTADLLSVDLRAAWDSVRYCAFLLQAEVTDSALLALSKEILAERGPLPVGEIGKLLQEATANASLSQTLKDQFGGLKKFIERYPHDFVISNDHPFNPSVYLRSAMTEVEVESVLHGASASQGGAGRKAKKSRNRGKQHRQPGQGGGGSGSGLGGSFGGSFAGEGAQSSRGNAVDYGLPSLQTQPPPQQQQPQLHHHHQQQQQQQLQQQPQQPPSSSSRSQCGRRRRATPRSSTAGRQGCSGSIRCSRRSSRPRRSNSTNSSLRGCGLFSSQTAAHRSNRRSNALAAWPPARTLAAAFHRITQRVVG